MYLASSWLPPSPGMRTTGDMRLSVNCAWQTNTSNFLLFIVEEIFYKETVEKIWKYFWDFLRYVFLFFALELEIKERMRASSFTLASIFLVVTGHWSQKAVIFVLKYQLTERKFFNEQLILRPCYTVWGPVCTCCGLLGPKLLTGFHRFFYRPLPHPLPQPSQL